jgi:hypothetical protein
VRIRTTEPVQGTNGKIYPTGTEATFVGESRWSVGMSDGTRVKGKDFETEDGATLWALVPVQYEVIEQEDSE